MDVAGPEGREGSDRHRAAQPEEAANPVAYATARHIVASWHAVGLAVRTVPLPASELLGDRLAEGEFQVALVPLAIGLDPDLYPLLAVVADPDRRLEHRRPPGPGPRRAPRRRADSRRRGRAKAAYTALQERLAERPYVLPLAFRDEYVLFRDTVVGPESRPVAASGDRYWDVLTWRLADGS